MPAHCFELKRCKPWPSSGRRPRPPQKRRRPAPGGLAACDRCVALEGPRATERGSKVCGRLCRRRLPQKASTKSRAQPPQKLENAVVDLSSEDKPRKVAVTTADVKCWRRTVAAERLEQEGHVGGARRDVVGRRALRRAAEGRRPQGSARTCTCGSGIYEGSKAMHKLWCSSARSSFCSLSF